MIFASKTFLSKTVDGIRDGTIIVPRAGYTYDVDVSYKDHIYNVTVDELHHGKVVRKLSQRCWMIAVRRDDSI